MVALPQPCVSASVAFASDHLILPIAPWLSVSLFCLCLSLCSLFVSLSLSSLSLPVSPYEKTEMAVTKWLCVLHSYMLASTTGRQVVHLGKGMENPGAARQTARSVIGVRPSTIAIGRANSILSFYRWVAEQKDVGFHPFHEEVVWKFFNELQSTNAARKPIVCLPLCQVFFFASAQLIIYWTVRESRAWRIFYLWANNILNKRRYCLSVKCLSITSC